MVPVMNGSGADGVEAEVREAVEQQVEDDRGLHAGQVQPEAEVRAVGEADVGSAGPVDVEAVGVVPALLVVVGRAEVADDGGALGDRRRRTPRVSRVAVREMIRSGGSQRMPSSIAGCDQRAVLPDGRRAAPGRTRRPVRAGSTTTGRSSRHRPAAAGGRRRRCPRRRAAGRPARRWPAPRSCPRGARLGAARGCRRSTPSARADAATARSKSTDTPISSTASRWNRGRSSSGSPSSAAMTASGNGNRSWRTRSARPSSTNPSIIRSTSGPTSSVSHRSMARLVNACWRIDR